MHRKSSLLLLFSLFSLFTQAQKDTSFLIGIRPQYGFLIAHRPSMVHLLQQHIPSVEVYAERPLTRKDWHKNFHYPSHGLSFYMGNLANPSLIGYGYALIHYVNMHFIRKEHFEWNIRLGTGLGYISKPFDRNLNNKNNSIGSHLNGIMSTQTQILFKRKKMDLGGGISMLHYSNGSFKMPNLGINMPSVFLTAQYKFGDHSHPLHYPETAFQRSFYTSVLFSAGTRELGQPGGDRYSCFSLEGFSTWQFSRKSGLLFGMDLLSNGALRTAYHTEFGSYYPRKDFTQLGIMAGFELSMDELKISLQMGAYAISKYKGDGPMYHRLAIRYFFPNNLIAQIALKTHFAKADYLEAGIGYRLAKRKKE